MIMSIDAKTLNPLKALNLHTRFLLYSRQHALPTPSTLHSTGSIRCRHQALYPILGAYNSRAANASIAAGHPGSTDTTRAWAAATFMGHTCRPKACISNKDLSNTFIFFSRSTCNQRQIPLHAPHIHTVQYTHASHMQRCF